MRQRGRVLWYHHDVIFDRCWIDCFVLWQLTPVSIKTVTFSAADVHLVSGRWTWADGAGILRPTRVYRGANYASLSLCSSGHKSWASVAIIYGILHLDLTLDHNPQRIFCLLSRASASACISGGSSFRSLSASIYQPGVNLVNEIPDSTNVFPFMVSLKFFAHYGIRKLIQ